MNAFTDRFLAAADDKGAPVCVGLDPVYERLPASLQQRAADAGARVHAIHSFCQGVLEAVADHVPAVKFQAACFERYRAPGFAVLFELIQQARELGLIVILDAKRGDIGTSSAHYAVGLLADPQGPDALTVNAYLGADGLEPFTDLAAVEGKGLFALVRTSNPGGDAIQGLTLTDGRTVGEAVADVVADLGKRDTYIGDRGYSLLGAVVGATKPADAKSLRDRMPEQLFLVPGFGAQGGTADDVRACFKPDRTGAIVTASRSVLYAYEKSDVADWQTAIATAAGDLNQQIADILK
ncbi:orotidine-5'-phosphate decarboxylase [Phycisphaerales bacterium AB-hyl4]|uniref:Orotidine 5'-phosphate decarboxylase n=1 Tax=Natronomicrosphaera hydrolytica TaxID=3242702 RepID=A0ABV4UA46_9BACT